MRRRAWKHTACLEAHRRRDARRLILGSHFEKSLRRRGLLVGKETNALFALDVVTGERKWVYQGGSIEHVTIAIGDGRVFFIDSSISSEQREALLRQDKSELAALGPAAAEQKEAELKQLDVRLAVCLDADSGTTHYAGHRLGCWVNAIPANGLLLVPEASAGCVCAFSLTATVVLEPRDDRESWRLFSAGGDVTPVRHLAVNFGAPGDRRDREGTLWIAHPRPATVGRLKFVLDLPVKLAPSGGYYQHNDASLTVENAVAPWVFTSGVRGLGRSEFPLRGENDPPAEYSARLLFAALEEEGTFPLPFDIKLQGTLVAENIDVVIEAGGPGRTWECVVEAVTVSDSLVLELVPSGEATLPEQLPCLAGIEIRRIADR